MWNATEEYNEYKLLSDYWPVEKYRLHFSTGRRSMSVDGQTQEALLSRPFVMVLDVHDKIIVFVLDWSFSKLPKTGKYMVDKKRINKPGTG